MFPIQLVVFDMAGTTVEDKQDVENCFYDAAVRTGLQTTREKINAMHGMPKRLVIETFWAENIGKTHPEYEEKVNTTFKLFRELLENRYRTQPVLPTEGALETFAWLRSKGVKIALTTGFYREVTNIILNRLGWDEGLNENYEGNAESIIDLSLTPNETGKGRPHPDMILKAMEILGVSDSKKVVNIGDTPADLQSGKAANVLLSLGVCNGSHTREELLQYENDGLIDSMKEFPAFLENALRTILV